jgi:hypothetical protein
MTVGTSPTESGTTTPSSGPSHQAVGAESRRALRAHRRQRRRIAIGCAVFITVCVVITLVIVNIARDRTSTPQSAAPSPEGAVVHIDRSFIALAPSTDIPGAPAPVGGHR